MIESIGDTLYSCFNFKLINTLFLKGDQNEDSKYKKHPIISSYDIPNTDNSKIFLSTANRSILGFIATKYNDESVTTEAFYLTQKHFHDLDVALTICVDWLKSKQFKYLYNINADGKVIGLGTPPPYNPIIYRNEAEYIRFQPAVVKDFNGISYEGIAIRTQRNTIVQLTCNEFFTMCASVKSYINNIYGNNVNLLNTTLLYNLLKKTKTQSVS